MVTLAPELNGAIPLIEFLTKSGVVCSVGHSESDSVAFEAGIAAGMTHAAHLWSGQSSVHRRDLQRVAGVLEMVLSRPEMTGEVIADDTHLPPELLRIAAMCLGQDRLCLVSDSSPGSGLADGETFCLGETDAYV